MFQFANRARVIAGVMAGFSAAGSAFAGEPTTQFTTLHAATIDFTYTGRVANVATESASYGFDFNGPANGMYFGDPIGSYGFGKLANGVAGWAIWDDYGKDLVSGGIQFNNSNFGGQEIYGTLTWDLEFSSAEGGVFVDELSGAQKNIWSAVNSLGESIDFSEGAILANGRYTISLNFYSYSQQYWLGGIGADMYFGSASVVPAPGAIALLGLAGLAGRRRR